MDKKSILLAGDNQCGIRRHRELENGLIDSVEKFIGINGSVKDAIIMIDSQGIITFWNESAEKIFCYTKEDTIGKELHRIIFPVNYHNSQRKGFNQFSKNGWGSFCKIKDFKALRKDGEIIPIELSLSSLKIKGKWNLVCITGNTAWQK